jgi:glutamyl-tRNA synthetase
VVHDLIHGEFSGIVDDFVIRRGDGVAAYNLAVVIDDASQEITQVVRGDDLLESTPRQMLLQELLGLEPVTYAHVPLVVGSDGERLAKRHGLSDGGVTLTQLIAAGRSPGDVMASLLMSTGFVGSGMIPEPLVIEIRQTVGQVDLDPVAATLRDRSPDLQVTPKEVIYRDTL